MPKRSITPLEFTPRPWQQEAFEVIQNKRNAGESDCLIVATPGAGKTKLGLMVIHDFLKKKIVERAVIITFTDRLKRQWAEEAAFMAGIDIDPDFSNAQGIEATDYYGIAVTYALLGQDKKNVHAQATFNRKTLVIFDEIHHAGESLIWGDAIRNAFDNAVFRLGISGTAFRSDDNQIPYIKYDELGVSIADYSYSYERAIRENVCRPVYFSSYDGQMQWKVGSLEFDHTFNDILERDQVSKRLKTALDPGGNYVKKVILEADQKLSEIRETHYDAAGLIFASTQKHARELAKIVKEVTGEDPPIVVSEETDSSNMLGTFKNSKDRWMVSVKMVSEGVDIPRLRVGIYFTIVKAELFFRQAIGRFVRVLEHLQYQDAYIFIPQDRDIVKLAETIQEERDHALDKGKPNNGNNIDGQQDMFGGDYTPALQGRFLPLGSEATDEKTISVNIEISTRQKKSKRVRSVETEPVFVQKEMIRNRLNNLAKRIALHRRGNIPSKPDWKFAHKQWIQRGGKEMDLETLEELKRREEFYQSLLRSC